VSLWNIIHLPSAGAIHSVGFANENIAFLFGERPAREADKRTAITALTVAADCAIWYK
jgi:hypothetical protein